MISTNQAADQLRIAYNTPVGETPVAVLARGLIDKDGNVTLAGQSITAEVTETLTGSGSIGTLNTIAAGQVRTVGANSQAIIFGTFTILGTLTVSGELRVGAWPF